MTNTNKLIRFDWAIKHILRDKANFDVLEGFLTAVLSEKVKVIQLIESETNQEQEDSKFNRVDILIEDSNGRHLIIEVQNQHKSDYIYRLLFGTSKVIVDTLQLGRPYSEIIKVISISILYFNLGSGDDYVYHGTTKFKGLHTEKPLNLRKREQIGTRHYLRQMDVTRDIFPEYYLIQVERFEDVVQSPLDEWIYMLKNEEIRDDFSSHNIDRAREKLTVLKMGRADKKKYENYMMSLVDERDIMKTAHADGHAEGRKEGREEGRKAEKIVTARKMLIDGLDRSAIMKYTGISSAEFATLLDK